MVEKKKPPGGLDLLDDMLEIARKTTEGIKEQPEPDQTEKKTEESAGILGAIDLSDPVREVYLWFVKHGEMTLEEAQEFADPEEKDMVPIYARILVRQGYLERFKEGNVVKYRPVMGERRRKKVSEDIWEALK